MKNKFRKLTLAFLTLLLLVSIAYRLNGSSFANPLNEFNSFEKQPEREEGDFELTINSSEEWKSYEFNVGRRKYLIEDGKLKIRSYGKNVFGRDKYPTVTTFRTRAIGFKDKKFNLDTLKAKIHFSKKYNSSATIWLKECGNLLEPGNLESRNKYCDSDYAIYGTDFIYGSGDVIFEDDVSDFTINNRLMIHPSMGINSSHFLPENQEIYIDWIKLNGTLESKY